MFDREELLHEPSELEWVNSTGVQEALPLKVGQFGFTFGRVPIVFQVGEPSLTIIYQDGTEKAVEGNMLSIEDSASLFQRKNRIARIHVNIGN